MELFPAATTPTQLPTTRRAVGTLCDRGQCAAYVRQALLSDTRASVQSDLLQLRKALDGLMHKLARQTRVPRKVQSDKPGKGCAQCTRPVCPFCPLNLRCVRATVVHAARLLAEEQCADGSHRHAVLLQRLAEVQQMDCIAAEVQDCRRRTVGPPAPAFATELEENPVRGRRFDAAAIEHQLTQRRKARAQEVRKSAHHLRRNVQQRRTEGRVHAHNVLEMVFVVGRAPNQLMDVPLCSPRVLDGLNGDAQGALSMATFSIFCIAAVIVGCQPPALSPSKFPKYWSTRRGGGGGGGGVGGLTRAPALFLLSRLLCARQRAALWRATVHLPTHDTAFPLCLQPLPCALRREWRQLFLLCYTLSSRMEHTSLPLAAGAKSWEDRTGGMGKSAMATKTLTRLGGKRTGAAEPKRKNKQKKKKNCPGQSGVAKVRACRQPLPVRLPSVSDAGGALSLVALCKRGQAKGDTLDDFAENRDLKRSLDSFNNMLWILSGAFGFSTRASGGDRSVKAIRAAFVQCSSAVLGNSLARKAVEEHNATVLPRLETVVGEFSHIDKVNPNKAVYSSRVLLLLGRADPDGLGSAESMSAIAAGARKANVYGRKLSCTETVQSYEQEVLRLKASNNALSEANMRLETALRATETENAALREQLTQHGLQATVTDTSIDDMLSMPLALSAELSVALGQDS